MTDKQKEYLGWLAAIGLTGAAIYGVYFFFIKSSTVEADLDKLKKQGITPTITDTQAENIADSLDAEINELYPDTNDLLTLFNNVNNLADMLLIIAKYGERFHFGVGYIGTFTLPAFMRKRLNTEQISLVNSYLTSKNINYKF